MAARPTQARPEPNAAPPPEPRQSLSPRPVAGVLGIEKAALTGVAPASAVAGAGGAAGVLTLKAITRVVRAIIASFELFQKRRATTIVPFIATTVRRQYPERTVEEIKEIVTREVEFERAFRLKQIKRLRRDLPKAMSLLDPNERGKAVKKVLDREKRYTAMRETAMAERAIAAAERMTVKSMSPLGAFWRLSRSVAEHTPDCIALGEQFWPWEVLDILHPPLHPGCPCALYTLDEAVDAEWMDFDQIPKTRDAIIRARNVMQKFKILREAALPGELEAAADELLAEAGFKSEQPRDDQGRWRITSWHLTDNPKFAFDPRRVGQINSTIGGEMSEPGLFVTQDPEFWINRHDYVRPFVAEIEHPSEVGPGYYEGADQYLPASLYGESVVKRVIPLDEYVRERFGDAGWIEDFHGDAPKTIPKGYRYAGPDVRDMPVSEVQRHLDRVRDYIEGSERRYTMLRTFNDSGDYAVDEHGDPVFAKWRWGYTAAGKRLREAYDERLHPRDPHGRWRDAITRNVNRLHGSPELMRAAAAHVRGEADGPDWAREDAAALIAAAREQVDTLPRGEPLFRGGTWKQRSNPKKGDVIDVPLWSASLGENVATNFANRTAQMEGGKPVIFRLLDTGGLSVNSHVDPSAAFDEDEWMISGRFEVVNDPAMVEFKPGRAFPVKALSVWLRRVPEAPLLEADYREHLHPRDRVGRWTDKPVRPQIRTALRDIAHLETPRVRRKTRAGKWVNLRGARTFIPEQRDFGRTVGGIHYTSPIGSTNLYRNGDLMDDNHPELQKGGEPVPYDLTPPKGGDAAVAARLVSRATQDQEIAARAKIERALLGEGEPVDVGDPGYALHNALEDAGFIVVNTEWEGDLTHITYAIPDIAASIPQGSALSGSRAVVLNVIYAGEKTGDGGVLGGNVLSYTWEPEPPSPGVELLPDLLNRPPRSWDEFTRNIATFAYDLSVEHGGNFNLSDIVTVDGINDHAGMHLWDGTMQLGRDVLPDVMTMVAKRETGKPLSSSEQRRVYASYKVAVHEALHSANHISPDLYQRGEHKGLEEALTEELSHHYAVELLKREGQGDVLRWVRENYNSPTVLGTYPGYRANLDGILNTLMVPVEDRTRFLSDLKWNGRTEDRFKRLGKLAEERGLYKADDRVLSPAHRAEDRFGHRMAAYTDAEGNPTFLPNAYPLTIPSALAEHTPDDGKPWGDKRVRVGSKIEFVRSKRKGDKPTNEVEQVSGRVEEIETWSGDGPIPWVVTVRAEDGRTSFALTPSQIVSVEDTGPITTAIGEHVFGPGQVVHYDGNHDGSLSEAVVTRVIDDHPERWVIEAVTTEHSKDPGTPVYLTDARVHGVLHPVEVPAEVKPLDEEMAGGPDVQERVERAFGVHRNLAPSLARKVYAGLIDRLPGVSSGQTGFDTHTWFHVTTKARADSARSEGIKPRSALGTDALTFPTVGMDEHAVYLWPTRKKADDWARYLKGRGYEGTETLRVYGIEPSKLGPDHESFGELVLRPYLYERSFGKPLNMTRLPSGEHESDYAALLDQVGFYEDAVGGPERVTLREWLDRRPEMQYASESIKNKAGRFWYPGTPHEQPPKWLSERDPWRAAIDALAVMPTQMRVELAREFSARDRAVQFYGTIPPGNIDPPGVPDTVKTTGSGVIPPMLRRVTDVEPHPWAKNPTERVPLIYVPKADTIYVGPGGTHHVMMREQLGLGEDTGDPTVKFTEASLIVRDGVPGMPRGIHFENHQVYEVVPDDVIAKFAAAYPGYTLRDGYGEPIVRGTGSGETRDEREWTRFNVTVDGQERELVMRPSNPGQTYLTYEGDRKKHGQWRIGPPSRVFNVWDGRKLVGSLHFALIDAVPERKPGEPPEGPYFYDSNSPIAVLWREAYVKPEYRGSGVFDVMTDYIARMGAPVYANFENKRLKAAFERWYQPITYDEYRQRAERLNATGGGVTLDVWRSERGRGIEPDVETLVSDQAERDAFMRFDKLAA